MSRRVVLRERGWPRDRNHDAMLEKAVIHSIRAGIGALGLAVPLAAVALQVQPPVPAAWSSHPSNCSLFIRAIPIGAEQMSVERAGAGWRISGSGRAAAPLNSIIRRVEVRYDQDWKPIELIVDATVRGEVASIHTIVTGTTT